MELTPVFVLHTRPFRNTSLLVDLFSETDGLISAVARSARGPKSRYQGKLQLFTPMLASWVGRHELKTLANIELTDMPFQLDQKPLFCAFYLNELLMRVLQKEDAYPKLFQSYQCALMQLAKRESMTSVLRLFEKKLLDALGYGLPLDRESKTGDVIQASLHYDYQPQQGFVCSHNQTPTSFLGQDLIAIAAEEFEEAQVLAAAKRLMRLALAPLLGDKPLNSRALF